MVDHILTGFYDRLTTVRAQNYLLFSKTEQEDVAIVVHCCVVVGPRRIVVQLLQSYDFALSVELNR